MITRTLCPDEWPRLKGTELEHVWPHLPDGARIVVVEEGDDILACHAVLTYVHIEGLWVHPKHRHGTVGWRLWQAVQREVRELGANVAITGALTEQVKALIEHVHGVKLPGDAYVIPIGDV